MKLDHFLTPHIKINSNWVKDLNVRPKTTKNPRRKHSNDLRGTPVLATYLWIRLLRQGKQNKIYYWDYTKMKSFFTAKETKKKTKTKTKRHRANGRRYLQMVYLIRG